MKKIKLCSLGLVHFLIAGLIVPFIANILLAQTQYKSLILLFKGQQLLAAVASIIIGIITASIGLWLGSILTFYLIRNISLIKENGTKILFISLTAYVIYDVLNLALTFTSIFRYNMPISYVLPFLILSIIIPFIYYFFNKKYISNIGSANVN